MAPLRGSHSVFLEMEFAATTITVWLNWMRCQSFRTSIDQLTGSHSNSPGKYNRDYGLPQDSWSSTGWQLAETRLRVDGKPSCQNLSKMLLQTGIALIWTGPTNRPDMVPSSPLINFVIAQGKHFTNQKCQSNDPPTCLFCLWNDVPTGLAGLQLLKTSLTLKDLCILLRGLLQRQFFAMVEFAALTAWLHWMRCQPVRTSIDKMTESHSNSSGKYDRECGFPQDSSYSIAGSWQQKNCESMERHPAKACQKWLLQTFILMGCDTNMVDIWSVLKVFPFHVCMGSSTNWPRVNCWSCNLR